MGGGQMKFYPYEKGGGAEKVLAMPKGAGQKEFWGSYSAEAILEGEAQKVSTL